MNPLRNLPASFSLDTQDSSLALFLCVISRFQKVRNQNPSKSVNDVTPSGLWTGCTRADPRRQCPSMGACLVTQVLSFPLEVVPEVAGMLSVDCGPSQPVTLTFPLCLCLGKMLRNLQESRFVDQCQQVSEPPHLESTTARTLPVPPKPSPV